MQQPSSSTTTLTTRRTTTTTTRAIMSTPTTTTISAAQQLTQEALGGLAAGIIGTIIGYPLDVMKTRLQTSSSHSGTYNNTTRSSHGRFRGLTLVADIVRTEGLIGLYRGVGPPLVSLSLLNTMSFTSYGYFRKNVYGGADGFDIRNALAGVTGAPAFALISTVENRLKTQLQVQRGVIGQQQHFRNSWQCAQYLVRHDGGVSSLYKGHVVNTLREAVFVANYFFVYEGVKELLFRELPQQPQQDPQKDAGGSTATPFSIPPHQLAIPLAGGIAGASSWAVSFPLDCVRAGVQSQTASSTGGGGGALTVFRDLVQRHGLAGLYQGVGPSIARAFLVSGSRFSAYEGALWLLRSSSSSSSSGSE
jgi:solute carrier family 25 (mitochondrial carnitine/acylcarnitine transporter), member 20/29